MPPTDGSIESLHHSRALVIVSGGAAESPFTTPTTACQQGLAAGNTDTALREYLLAAGHNVYTSPAKAGPGAIDSSPGFGGFADGPAPLPADLTVDAVGDIDQAGAHLAAFLLHLRRTFGVTDVDLVGHSMGGLFSRSAIRILRSEVAAPLRIRSLVTIGTPWEGSFAADYASGALDRSVARDNEDIATIMDAFRELTTQYPGGAGAQVTRGYLDVQGWNERQSGVLDGIAVTLIGGSYYPSATGSDSTIWPNDGLVSLSSSHALGVSPDVLPRATRLEFPDVHSIFFADQLGLSWEQGLTWDPAVLAAVARAVAD